jgi:hypothetical protein
LRKAHFVPITFDASVLSVRVGSMARLPSSFAGSGFS